MRTVICTRAKLEQMQGCYGPSKNFPSRQGFLATAVTIVLLCPAAKSEAELDDNYWHNLGPGITAVSQPPVSALQVYDEMLIAAGRFDSAGNSAARNIAAWDGTAWTPLGDGVNSWVRSLSVFDGSLIAGGAFDSAGAVVAQALAKWDGNSWTAFPSQTSIWISVERLYAHQGNLVVAGNYFDSVGGHGPFGISRWDGDNWHPMNTGFTSAYTRDFFEYNSVLHAVGYFQNLSGLSGYGVAQHDGSSWSRLGGVFPGGIETGVVYHDSLFVAGWFAPNADSGVVVWNGVSWSNYGSASDSTEVLAVYKDQLIAGGWRSAFGPGRIQSFDGAIWSELGSGVSTTTGPTFAGVLELCVYRDALIVAGYFTAAGGKAANHIALWDRSACPVALTGDINLSGTINSADIIGLVNYVFKNGADPLPCAASGDINCSGLVNSADIISLVNYVFKGGAAPCDVCSIIPGIWSCP